MESLERAEARRMQAELNRQRFEPPVIRTVSDIKRVLSQLEPRSRLNMKLDDVLLTADMPGTDTDSRGRMFRVSARTKNNSSRDILLEGFKVLKQREEMAAKAIEQELPVAVNDKEMRPPPVIAEDSFMSIDPMISRMLGGNRSGCFVQWNLTDGFTYRYDIFSHRLTRFETEKPGG